MIGMAQRPDDVEDQIEQAYKMAGPVDPHATLTAPIGPPAPEPMTMAGGPTKMAAPTESEAPPTGMSAISHQRERYNDRLMADQAKDDAPATGFFGKLEHGLSSAIPGVMRQFHGTEASRKLNEEPELQKNLQDLSKVESTQGLQGAQAGNQTAQATGKNLENANAPQREADAHTQSGATTRHLNDESDALENSPAPVQSLANGHAYAVDQAIKRGVDPADDPIVQHYEDAIQRIQKQAAAPKEANPQQQTYDDLIKGGMTPVQAYEKIREKPAGTTINQGTWSLQNDTEGKPILFNSKTGETREAPANLARKPNAEEIKRNDLAGNVNENLNTLEEILTRRPELFGPIAGRMTKAKEMIGTSDPDVAALKTIEDNLGMALQSAHGMRSAQHVATSAESVLNGLKNEPNALRAAIKTARSSVGTFQHDAQNTNEAGHGDEPQRPANVPAGYKFNQSGPKGPGWYK